MPQVFKIGSYWIYFWTIVSKWMSYFGEAEYFC